MSDRNFDNTTPSAPDGGVNVTWQQDGNGNLSAYTPLFGPSGTDHASGLVPDPGSTAGTTHYLREDGNWEIPSTGSGAFPAGANIIPLPPASSSSGAGENGLGGYSLVLKALGTQLQAFTSKFQVTYGVLALSSYVGSTYNTEISSAVIRRTASNSTTWIDSTAITWGGSSSPTFTPGGGNVVQYEQSDAISVAFDTAHDFYIIIYFNPTQNINAWAAGVPSASLQGVTLLGIISGNQTATGSASSFASLGGGQFGITQLITA